MEVINRLSNLDQRVFLRCASFGHQHVLVSVARAISRTGDGYLQILLPLLMVFIGGAAALTLLKMTLLAFAIERSLYWGLKNSLKRRRPPQTIPSFSAAIKAADEFSFPSGHTSGAFLLATIFLFYMPAIGVMLLVWACCIGCSRVVLGVHFPADILAGLCLGSAIGWALGSTL